MKPHTYPHLMVRLLTSMMLMLLMACGVNPSLEHSLDGILQAETAAGWRYDVPLPEHLKHLLELEVSPQPDEMP